MRARGRLCVTRNTGGGQGYDLGNPQNLKRSLVMSHFDGTKFGVIAQLTYGAFFLVFRKN